MNPVAWLSWQPTWPSPFSSEKQKSQLATSQSEREGPDWNRRTSHIVKKVPPLGVDDFCCKKEQEFQFIFD